MVLPRLPAGAPSAGRRDHRRRGGGAVPSSRSRRAGTLQALRSVTLRLGHPEQPGQDRARWCRRAKLRAEGRPADARSTPRRSRRRSAAEPGAAVPGARPISKARAGLKLQADPEPGGRWPRRARRSSAATWSCRTCRRARAALKEEEAAAAVANAERDLAEGAGRAATTSSRCWPRASSPSRSWSAPQQAVARARRTWRSRSGAATRSCSSAGPLELSQARSDAMLDARRACASSSRRAGYKLEQKQRRHRVRGEPHPGGGQQAVARPAAARAHRGARRRPRHRGLPRRLLRLRAAQAAGGRPGVGQPAAPDPARHLEDGRGDEGARDRHPQDRGATRTWPCGWRPTRT